MIRNIFAVFCFLFLSFLLIVVVYETVITGELPTDNDKKEKAISDKYSILPKALGYNTNDDELEIYKEYCEANGFKYSDNKGCEYNANIKIAALDEDEEHDDEKEKHEKGWYD